MEDLAAAVRWLYEHAEDYGYDRDPFFIGGNSSGARLAMLIAFDSTYLDQLSAPILLMCDNKLYNYTRLFETKIRETAFRAARVV